MCTNAYLASNLSNDDGLLVLVMPLVSECNELLRIGIVEVDRYVGELYKETH